MYFRAGTDPGRLEELQVPSKAQSRDNRVTVYLPADFDPSARYPFVVVHDGGDYVDYGSMKLILDNLMHDKMLAKIIVAFTYPASGSSSIRTILIMPGGSLASCCPCWSGGFHSSLHPPVDA